MKAALLYFIFITITGSALGQRMADVPYYTSAYTKEVGDIAFDPRFDDPAFNVPDSIIIFSKPKIDGEKPTIVNYFKGKYTNKDLDPVNGYMIIHFLVNSNGKAGKFRIQEMAFTYQPVEFDKRAAIQLLELIKALEGWQPISYEGRHYGYYSYLNFKIIDGQIKEITP